MILFRFLYLPQITTLNPKQPTNHPTTEEVDGHWQRVLLFLVRDGTTTELYYWLLGTGWLVGCFGFKGALRQYFILYRAVSTREGEKERKDR